MSLTAGKVLFDQSMLASESGSHRSRVTPYLRGDTVAAPSSILAPSRALPALFSRDAGRSGGFPLFPGRPIRRIRHERRIVMAAEREPEQFENSATDLLLRLSKSLRVRDHQLVC